MLNNLYGKKLANKWASLAICELPCKKGARNCCYPILEAQQGPGWSINQAYYPSALPPAKWATGWIHSIFIQRMVMGFLSPAGTICIGAVLSGRTSKETTHEAAPTRCCCKEMIAGRCYDFQSSLLHQIESNEAQRMHKHKVCWWMKAHTSHMHSNCQQIIITKVFHVSTQALDYGFLARNVNLLTILHIVFTNSQESVIPEFIVRLGNIL